MEPREEDRAGEGGKRGPPPAPRVFFSLFVQREEEGMVGWKKGRKEGWKEVRKSGRKEGRGKEWRKGRKEFKRNVRRIIYGNVDYIPGG